MEIMHGWKFAYRIFWDTFIYAIVFVLLFVCPFPLEDIDLISCNKPLITGSVSWCSRCFSVHQWIGEVITITLTTRAVVCLLSHLNVTLYTHMQVMSLMVSLISFSYTLLDLKIIINGDFLPSPLTIPPLFCCVVIVCALTCVLTSLKYTIHTIWKKENVQMFGDLLPWTLNDFS